ncbi:MAG: carboxypeptidase-like regulatory domain-containing protein, partial [Bacteroidetes bacterium]|nr:carboxypeptidase-like regulatory domain-containing protein [Bacteroidota bacterium]
MKCVTQITPGILLFLVLPLLAFTQTITQNIRGTVRDADTQLPLAGVRVMIPDLQIGTHTDENGHFKIQNVPLGRHDLKIAFLGYEEQNLNNLLLSAGKEMVLNLNMIESIVEIEEVVIQANAGKNNSINELSVVSTRAFTVEETKRYAGSFNDPSRMALSFAGVTGGESDEENEIIVRGNSPRML